MIYLDSSAAVKLISAEPETGALKRFLTGSGHEPVVTAMLTDTELRRAGLRVGAAQTLVSYVLDHLDRHDVTREDYVTAGLIPGAQLRTLDALHLAVALRLGVDRFVTYDHRQAAVAEELGLSAIAPR